MIYVEPMGKKTRTLCMICEKKDKIDKTAKLNAGFGPIADETSR